MLEDKKSYAYITQLLTHVHGRIAACKHKGTVVKL